MPRFSKGWHYIRPHDNIARVFDWQIGGGCDRGTTDRVNLQFLTLNFAEKTFSTPEKGGNTRGTPIKNFERVDGDMIVQGVEGSRAWSMVIAKEAGKISATVSDDQVGFGVFGACLPF